MQKDFLQSERDRYNTLLSLSYSEDYRHSVYKHYDKSLALLNEICELSETQQGRTLILEIRPGILGYDLMEALRTQWHWRLPDNYKRVDNAILRSLVNLVGDLRFHQSLSYIKDQLKAIRRVCNPTWNKLCSTIFAKIADAEKRIKQQTPVRLFKASFSSKEQSVAEINKYDDFYNFSGRAIHFEREYESYIDMLRGALRVGAHNEVIHVFPKSCFGCVIFSMVNTGHRLNKKRVAVTFLKELTGGWFTGQLFDYILYHMKNLYRKIRSNTNFEDRYELVCLKFTQYDRSIYQYFNKLGDKFRKGTLAQSKKIRNMENFEKELNKLRYKQKLSQQCYQVRNEFRKRSQKSTNFLDISKIINSEQAAYLKQFLINKMKSLGFNFIKIAQEYDHNESLEKFKMRSFVDCAQNHSMFLARCKNGKIVGGYFTYPYASQNLIGTAELFTFDPPLHFDFGEMISRYQIMEQRLKRYKPQIGGNQNSKAIVQEYERYQRYESRKRYEDRIQEERRRRYFGSEEEFDEEETSMNNRQQTSESSEEEQEPINKPENVSHRLDFKIGNRIFNIMLSLKKENHESSDITWKRLASELPCSVKGEAQMSIQINNFEFYSIEGKRPNNE